MTSSPHRPPPGNPLPTLDDRLWLTVPEAGRLLGLGRSAAYAAAERGDLPVRKIGRRRLVPLPALYAWLGLDVTVPTNDDPTEESGERDEWQNPESG